MQRLWAVGCGLFVGVAAFIVGWVWWPIPAALLDPPAAASLVLTDRAGVPLRTVRADGGALRRWVPLGELDPRLLQAFVALEDRRFYEHSGVDARAVARAARDNLRSGRVVSGASTITMQLARLVAGSGRSWAGKANQALWAWRLERHLTKQQILEQYLNRVPLGQGAIGVAAAARLYFGADVQQLSLGQAALLAGIARSPSTDNPLVAPDRARHRRAGALTRMAAAGQVSHAEAAQAAREPALALGDRAPFLAPHFTTHLLRHLDDPATPSVAFLSAASLAAASVRTSLDLALQAELEAEVRHAVEVVADRQVEHGAVVVLDNPTGEILAWVGSPDFWAAAMGQVDMVVSARQPGSTLKPFVYGLALDRGATAATVLPDVPRAYGTPTGIYRPRNYDRTYHGPVRVREALASSYNVPAVELTDRLGTAAVLGTLHRAGFTSLSRPADHYGLGIALGNGDVTLLELANGYRALANGGVWTRVTAIAGGAPAAPPGGERVMSASAAALVLDILADPVARVPGFGPGSPLELPFPAAAKTGTSRHFTDNWAVAVAGRFTVAVWVGNFSGRPMRGVSGVTGAGPLLHRAALAVARHYPPGALPPPAVMGAIPVVVCRLSGARAGPDCPGITEWFLPGTAPADGCGWHRGGRVVLPVEYAEWAGSEAPPVTVASAAPRPIPAEVDPTTGFHIVAPRDGDRFAIPPGTDPRYATIGLVAAGAPPGARVRWYVDARPVGGDRWALVSGTHVVSAVAGTSRDEVRILVR
jgi:penicillin-binding protein 1C